MESNLYLVAFDVFSVRVQTTKTKFAKNTLQAFKKTNFLKKNSLKCWIDKKTEYRELSKKLQS